MRWIRFSIILLVATILNTGDLLDLVSVGSLHIRPDLLLIILVFFASNCGMFEAIIASFAIGLAADISGSVMGPYTISFGLFGSLISQLRKVIIMKRMVHQCGAIVATGLLAGGLAHFLAHIKTHELTSNLYIALAGSAVYSGIIGPLIWSSLSAISRWLGIRRYRLSRSLNR
jgi:rod shape-determining protein MreD